jgi:hypothetical protein
VPLDMRHGPEKGFPGCLILFLTIRPVTQITARNIRHGTPTGAPAPDANNARNRRRQQRLLRTFEGSRGFARRGNSFSRRTQLPGGQPITWFSGDRLPQLNLSTYNCVARKSVL